MPDEVVAGLIVAGVSGLAVVAYRHPSGYRKLAAALVSLSGLAGVAIVAFRFGGIYVSGRRLARYVSQDTTASEWTRESAHSLLEAQSALGRTIIYILAAWAVLGALALLPRFLPLETTKPEKANIPVDQPRESDH